MTRGQLSLDRGQVYTLQGVIGAILIASALILGMQAVDIAPWANDPVGQETEQQRTFINDIFGVASDQNELRPAVTCVVDGAVGSPSPSAVSPNEPGTGFATLLAKQLEPNTDNFIVEVRYRDNDGTLQRITLYPAGNPQPRNGAVSVTTQFTLYNQTTLYEEDGNGNCVTTDDTVGANTDYYIEPGEGTEGSTVYNTVRLRVIAW